MDVQQIHHSKNIGSGHRIAGTAALLWYKLATDRYVRYLGFLDGLVRFVSVSADLQNVQFIHNYLKEFSDRVQNNLPVEDLSPAKYQNGRKTNLFFQINEKNKTHEVKTNPFNFFNILANPTHKANYLGFRNKYLPFLLFKNQMTKIYADYKEDVRVYDDKIATSYEEKKTGKKKCDDQVGDQWHNTVKIFISGEYVKFLVPNLQKETIDNIMKAREKSCPYGAMIHVKDVFSEIDAKVLNRLSSDVIADRYCTISSFPLSIPRSIANITNIEHRSNVKFLDTVSFTQRMPYYTAPNQVFVAGVSTTVSQVSKELLESPFFDADFNIVAMRKFADFNFRTRRIDKDKGCKFTCDLFCFGKSIQMDNKEDFMHPLPVFCNISGFYDFQSNSFVATFLDEMNGQPVSFALGDVLKDANLKFPFIIKSNVDDLKLSEKIVKKINDAYDLFLCDGKTRFKIRSYSTIVTSDLVGLITWYYRQNLVNKSFKGLIIRDDFENPGLRNLLSKIEDFGLYKFQSLPLDAFNQEVEELRSMFTLEAGMLNTKMFVAYFDNRFSPPHLIGIRFKDSDIERRKFNIQQTFGNQISKYFFEYRRSKNKTIHLEPQQFAPSGVVGKTETGNVNTYVYNDHLFCHDPLETFQKKKSVYCHFPPVNLGITDELYTDGAIDYGNFLQLMDAVNKIQQPACVDISAQSNFITSHPNKEVFMHFYSVQPTAVEEQILSGDVDDL